MKKKRTASRNGKKRKAGPTGRKRALTDRMMLDALLGSAEDMVYFKDRDSRFLKVSQAFAVRIGARSPRDLIGLTDHDIFMTEHAEEAARDEKKILRTGKPLVGKIEKETWSDGHITWASTTKLPLKGPTGEIIGTFGISRDVTKQHLAEQNLRQVAKELKTRNEVYESDLNLASEVFSAFAGNLPSRIPEGEASAFFHCASHYLPAASKLGGDFFIALPHRRGVRLLICDVMGHGVHSALVAVLLRTWSQQVAEESPTPAAWLDNLNRRLVSLFLDSGNCFTATAFACDLDPGTGLITYCSAGHPPPLIRTAQGDVRRIRNGPSQGPGMGFLHEAGYVIGKDQLEHGDCLLMFTDGLLEAKNAEGHDFDEERIVHALRKSADHPADRIIEQVKQEVTRYSGTNPQEDDICILAVERIVRSIVN